MTDCHCLYLPSCVSGHPPMSACLCLSVSLSDGWLLLQMFSSFGFLCVSTFHCLSGWSSSVASCPSLCFRPISLCLLGSFYVCTLVICLISPTVSPQNLGPSVLAGVALMVLLIPVNGAVAMKMRSLQVGAIAGAQLLPAAPGQVPRQGRSLTRGPSIILFTDNGWLQATFTNLSSLFPHNPERVLETFLFCS